MDSENTSIKHQLWQRIIKLPNEGIGWLIFFLVASLFGLSMLWFCGIYTIISLIKGCG